MRILALDFETFYSDDYTLSKMTQEAYLRDPLFEAQCLCASYLDGNTDYRLNQDEIVDWLEEQPWNEITVLAHHAAFDAGILSWRYGIRPRGILCTMSMARFVFGPQKQASLASLSERLGLGVKTVPYNEVKGKRWAEMSDETKRRLVDGCAGDVDLLIGVYSRLRGRVPSDELLLIDHTVRMFTEPVVRADAAALVAYAREENDKRTRLVEELNVTTKELSSNDKFAALLEAEGVELEYKDGKKGPIPAVASTDGFMRDLAAHDSERVRLLVEARLAAKSTIHRTRAERLAAMAQRGTLALYLNYCGAHTTRWSGGDRVNPQNLPPRIKPHLRAPKGYVFVIVDAAQIECRILNFIAGNASVCDLFAAGVDVYVALAARVLDKAEAEVDHGFERKVFKQVELGCGFGMGHRKFRLFLATRGVIVSEEYAFKAVNGYRTTHSEVCDLWQRADCAIPNLREFGGQSFDLCTGARMEPGYIELPCGVRMHYELDWDARVGKWRMKTKTGWRYIWGGTIVENVVQGLARVNFAQSVLRIYRQTGHRARLLCHDEGLWCVPTGSADDFLQLAVREIGTPIAALAGCPMKAEGIISERYDKP